MRTVKTLATLLVAGQELSENLQLGMALENLHGEYFYVNDCWPQIYSLENKQSVKKNESHIYPPGLISLIKNTEAEILNKKKPVGYVVEDKTNKGPGRHLVLRFIINYTSGTPFCFCTLAKRLETGDELYFLINKVKETFSIDTDPELFNYTDDK